MPHLTLRLLRIHLQIPLSVLKPGFPGGSVDKEATCNAGDTSRCKFPRSERSPGGGNGNLLQYSCLENAMDRGAWRATGHRVTELNMTVQLSMHAHPEASWVPAKFLSLTPCPFHESSLSIFSEPWTEQTAADTRAEGSLSLPLWSS